MSDGNVPLSSTPNGFRLLVVSVTVFTGALLRSPAVIKRWIEDQLQRLQRNVPLPLHETQDRLEQTSVREWDRVSGESLDVFDVSFASDHKSLPQVQFSNQKIIDRVEIGTALGNLPLQKPDTCRFYVTHGIERLEIFKAHVALLGFGQLFEAGDDESVSSIWMPLHCRLKSGQMPWWHTNICAFSLSSSYGGLLSGLLRNHLKFRCMWHEDGRMFCFVVGESDRPLYDPAATNAGEPMGARTSHLCHLIMGSDDVFEIAPFNTSSRASQKNLVMLRICYAVLLSYVDLQSKLDKRQDRLTPLWSYSKVRFTRYDMELLSKDSVYLEQTFQSISTFITAVGSFLDTLAILGDTSSAKGLPAFLVEVRGLCSELDKRTTSTSSRLETRLKLIEANRAYRESSRFMLISLLAAIFLPLSLASSILSMQTRFKDLNYLIFDFFGVTFVLVTLTSIMVGFLMNIQKLQNEFQRVKHRFYWPAIVLHPPRRKLLWVLLFGAWGSSLGLFIIGMLSGDGLGVGFTALGFIVGIGLCSLLLVQIFARTDTTR